MLLGTGLGILILGVFGGCARRPQASGPAAPAPAARELAEQALLDARDLVPYTASDHPRMVAASEATFITPQDAVLGTVVKGKARAYPVRFLAWHHAVNDRVDDLMFAITLCPVCRSGIRYDRRVGGKVLTFDFFGLYLGALALIDRETQTVWGQVSGKAVRGQLRGERLEKEALLQMDWGEWRHLHPDTVVMAPEPAAQYTAPGRVPDDYRSFPLPIFKRTWVNPDFRLAPFELALGISVSASNEKSSGDLRRAYPLSALRAKSGVVNDTVGDSSVVVVVQPASITAVAFYRNLQGRTLTFDAIPSGPPEALYRDRETGTRWSIEGRATSGLLAGSRLSPVSSHLCRWYGWSANYPETSIYGRG